jgi:hypothetical protein
MFTVHEHGYGRAGSTCQGGIAAGQVFETDLEGHEWRAVSDHKRKADAIEAAKAIPHHAVVVSTDSRYSFKPVFDNGKAPRARIDWPK